MVISHPSQVDLVLISVRSVIQNNLQYVAASNLDAATFQVTYQMKILTTAAFSVLLLRRKLSPSQWLALSFLAIGVGIVQLQANGAKVVVAAGFQHLAEPHSMNGFKGFSAVALACFTSGLAGVYFEMVLKNSQADLWVRNVQLSLFSLLPALAPVLVSHTQNASATSWLSSLFHNFGPWAWATVAVQVFGGLVTAMVIKYSDNILKGFATSLSIVLSFLASVALFDFTLTVTFVLGSTIVLVSTWLYNQPPKRSSTNIMVAMSTKENAASSGWHLPFSIARSEKLKDDSFWSPSTPLNLNLSTVSSSSSLWSLTSTPSDISRFHDPGDSVRLERQDGIYSR